MEFDRNNAVLCHAAEELERFASDAGERVFAIRIDPEAQPGTFGVNSGENGRVDIWGADASSALCAVYSLLEHAGVLFDVTGPILRQTKDISRIDGWSETFDPAVRWRGIRQHINFPMDISSYSLDEARDYIHNLSRMRFNAITFHSYPGQWYEADLSDGKVLAGGFFYNQTHLVPDHPVVGKALGNQRVFCIPEIEMVFDQPENRSRMAIEWLSEVIAECKRVGLRVQFSVEPRGAAIEDGIGLVESVLESYPTIDALELMTQECGCGYSIPPPSIEDARAVISHCFGSDALDDPDISESIVDGMRQLPGTVRELASNIDLARELQSRWSGRAHPTIVLGVYATDPSTLRIALCLLRRYAPEGIDLAFLPAHGGRVVVDSLEKMGMTRADVDRSMIYSWIEFDGSMYLQQNSIVGTRKLLEYATAVSGDHPVNGLCFNHWRTAENRAAIRYSAEACLFGPILEQEFYRAYAESLGISSVDSYTQAMAELDEADSYVRDNLFNVGFCYAGCWGLGLIEQWQGESLLAALSRYERVGSLLGDVVRSTTSAEGAQHASFLANRVQCTILHLRAIANMVELQPLCKEDIDDRLRAQIASLCDAAMESAEHYMLVHAQLMPDRGCEGTLVDYYQTLPAVIKRIRSEYVGDERVGGIEQETCDRPPLPAL